MSSRTPSSGIVSFAAVLFTLVGFLNAIHGWPRSSRRSTSTRARPVREPPGVGLDLARPRHPPDRRRLLIVGRATSGRTLGIFLAGASVIISFASLGAHPLGSTLIIALDVLIIWGLTTRAELFVPAASPTTRGRPAPSRRAALRLRSTACLLLALRVGMRSGAMG